MSLLWVSCNVCLHPLACFYKYNRSAQMTMSARTASGSCVRFQMPRYLLSRPDIVAYFWNHRTLSGYFFPVRVCVLAPLGGPRCWRTIGVTSFACLHASAANTCVCCVVPCGCAESDVETPHSPKTPTVGLEPTTTKKRLTPKTPILRPDPSQTTTPLTLIGKCRVLHIYIYIYIRHPPRPI